ncbi:MAG: peptidase domain-containing ABC transporter [Terriglobia bacterium]
MSDKRSYQQFCLWLTLVCNRAHAIIGRLMNWRPIRHLRRRRVPVLLQLNAVECGAACLAMVLSYHGRKTRVAECGEVCGAGRDGVTAETIAKAARSYGLRVAAFSLEPSQFKDIPVPAIAHWEFNHFVVVERWSPRWVEIVDPANGRRRVTAHDFAASFTGVILTLGPGIHFKPLAQNARTRRHSYLIGMFRTPDATGLMLQILAASLCTLLLGLALPLLTAVVVDRVLPLHSVSVMAILGLGLALVVVAQAVAAYLRAALLIYLQGRMDAQMTMGFFEHLLSLPCRFFQERNSGDLLMRLGSNAIIREALTNQTLSAILDGILVLGYLAVLLARAPVFGWLALALGFLQVAPLQGASRRLRELTQRDLAAQSASQSYLTEALSGMATLKASGTEDQALDRWSRLFTHELNASLRRGHCLAVLDTVATTLRALSPLLLLWVGTFQVLHGAMSLGTMLAVVGLAAAFLQPVSSLLTSLQRVQLVAANLERIADVLEAEPEQAPAGVCGAPRLTGRIELKNVSFRYAPSAPLVLRNISLTIEPGQKVALVGCTGSGKSTLAMLLLGLYAPTEGEILYDGFPLHHLNYRALRSQFGVVLQEPFLFSGSIRQNIAFSNPNLRLDQVVEAARLAAIDEEIATMPMGYETRISERGSGLSGGQRQRISLARALVHRPAMLLLDEATSHLDVVTELRVEHNLNQLACTRVVIAHRMSSVRNAAQIVVLEDGKVAERGRHHELLSQDGRYAALVDNSVGPLSNHAPGLIANTVG